MKTALLLFALGLLLLGADAHAIRPPDVDEEAADTASARAQYEALRRVNPYDANFDAAQARLSAYWQFRAELEAERQNPALRAQLSAPLHTEAWQAIGPAPILSGQTPTDVTPATRSAVSGRVSVLAIDAIDDAVYAGAAQGGVWRSSDHGASWTPIGDLLASLATGAIAIAPGNHAPGQATIYLGTGEGNFSADSYAGVGVYKSTNSGLSWQGPFGSAQFAGRSVGALVADGANPQIVLAGTALGAAGTEGDLPPNAPLVGIYRSADGAQTWTKVLPATGGLNISRLLQDPDPARQSAGATRYWAAAIPAGTTAGALFVSNDAGQTWQRVDGVAAGLPAYGVANARIRTWISATYDTTLGKTVLYFGVGVSPASQSQTHYAGKVHKSVDGGATWSDVGAADGYCQFQCIYDMPVYVEPGNSAHVYTGGSGVSGTLPSSFMYSADGGATFADEMVGVDGNSAVHADIHDIVTWPGVPNDVWVASDGGVSHSLDRGQHWISANTNLSITQFQHCDTHPTDPEQGYGGTQDNGTNGFLGEIAGPVPGAIAWSHGDDGDGGFALIDQDTPELVTHTYFNQTFNVLGAALAVHGPTSVPADYKYFAGEIYDSGGPYLTSGIDASDAVLFYAPLHLDRANATTLYYGTQSLYVANDFFNQTITQQDALAESEPPFTLYIYERLGPGVSFGAPIPPSARGGVISAIETPPSLTSGSNSSTIFVGTTNGNVWRSTDSGATFVNVDGTVGLYVAQIAVYPRNPQIVVQARAGFTGTLPAHNVRISRDGGTSWRDASSGLPDIPIDSLAWDPVFPGQLWAGTDIGMYLSADLGASWHPYNNGIPNVAVYSLSANRATHTVLACTHGRGAFRLNLDAIFVDGFDGN